MFASPAGSLSSRALALAAALASTAASSSKYSAVLSLRSCDEGATGERVEACGTTGEPAWPSKRPSYMSRISVTERRPGDT